MSVKQHGFCEGGEPVSEETYREERCLPAVVFFSKRQKPRKIVFFKTNAWVFHSGFVEPFDDDFK